MCNWKKLQTFRKNLQTLSVGYIFKTLELNVVRHVNAKWKHFDARSKFMYCLSVSGPFVIRTLQ